MGSNVRPQYIKFSDKRNRDLYREYSVLDLIVIGR